MLIDSYPRLLAFKCSPPSLHSPAQALSVEASYSNCYWPYNRKDGYRVRGRQLRGGGERAAQDREHRAAAARDQGVLAEQANCAQAAADSAAQGADPQALAARRGGGARAGRPAQVPQGLAQGTGGAGARGRGGAGRHPRPLLPAQPHLLRLRGREDLPRAALGSAGAPHAEPPDPQNAPKFKNAWQVTTEIENSLPRPQAGHREQEDDRVRHGRDADPLQRERGPGARPQDHHKVPHWRAGGGGDQHPAGRSGTAEEPAGEVRGDNLHGEPLLLRERDPGLPGPLGRADPSPAVPRALLHLERGVLREGPADPGPCAEGRAAGGQRSLLLRLPARQRRAHPALLQGQARLRAARPRELPQLAPSRRRPARAQPPPLQAQPLPRVSRFGRPPRRGALPPVTPSSDLRPLCRIFVMLCFSQCYLILPIIYNRPSYFRVGFCCYIFMSSSFLAPLPPAHSQRHLTLGGQAVLVGSEAQLEVLPGERPPGSEHPVIENYYCRARAGELVKVTLVRIGREVLRLTDRIALAREGSPEEDDRTKCSSNSSQQEVRQPKPRKAYFSKSSKALLAAFDGWAKRHDPGSLRAIVAMRQEYGSEHEVADFLACNSMVREAFLHFCDCFFAEGPPVRVGKLATRWMKRCLTVREHERLKEDYIEEVLQKM